MPITNSQTVSDVAQIDGRRSVHLRYLDHNGNIYSWFYLAEPSADVDAERVAYIPTLEAQLTSSERDRNIASILSGTYTVSTEWVTVTVMRQAVRESYLVATGEQVGRIAGFLLLQTDANLRTLFNRTQAEVNQLKVRLQAAVDALQTVLMATGE